MVIVLRVPAAAYSRLCIETHGIILVVLRKEIQT
jgi:hypothetical protein